MKRKLLKPKPQTLTTLTKDVIKKTSGCTFKVVFTKADGTERVMLAKSGIRKHLSKRIGKRVIKESSNLVRVFDMESKSYKSFKLDTVKEFLCKNISYVV